MKNIGWAGVSSQGLRAALGPAGARKVQYLELGHGTAQVKGFKLTLKTDFAQVKFPVGTLSPSRHQQTAAGHWQGVIPGRAGGTSKPDNSGDRSSGSAIRSAIPTSASAGEPMQDYFSPGKEQ